MSLSSLKQAIGDRHSELQALEQADRRIIDQRRFSYHQTVGENLFEQEETAMLLRSWGLMVR